MSDDDDLEPQTLVGIAFDDAFRAQEFLVSAQRLASREELVLRDAVVVSSDVNGHTKVIETIDPTPGRAALSGGAWAGLFGLILGGPVGWVAGAAIGAGAGAVTAKAVDLGMSDDWVHWFRDTVEPGTTIVALLVSQVDREAVLAEVERFKGGRLIYANVDPDAIHRIKAALGDTTPDPVEDDLQAPTAGDGTAADDIP